MTSKSPPSIAKATTTDNVKQHTTLYASPLAQHRSLYDVAGRCSPQPPRYASRPQSPPTSSPSVDPKASASVTNEHSDHRHDHHSPSSRDREEPDLRREQSPLPRIVSNDSSSANPSATVGSLEAAIGNYTAYSRRAISPRPMLRNSSQPGDTSTPTSFDSEHLRSISRGSPGIQSHQRSNSNEGHQSFKRWGPYTSPVPLHRMQQKPYVPTNLSSKDDSTNDKERVSPPLQLPKLQSRPISAESNIQSDDDKMSLDKTRGEVDLTDEQQHHAGIKRKDREEESAGRDGREQNEASARHSHFSSLAPPSSHLYGNMAAARREKIGSSNSADEGHRKGHLLNEAVQEHDELEDDSSDEARHQRSIRRTEGIILALAPQRKSCDRCFKMKTKCSRAAPGATGDEPCDGCIRRGYGDDCVTSRPDYPYPRISLPKRAKRESSLPALLDLNNKDAAVFVPPSMQRGNDWRSKLIVNSIQRGSSEGLGRGTQQHRQTAHHSMAGKRSVTPQPLPLRSQSNHFTSQPSSWQLHGYSGKAQTQEAASGNANRSHGSHLRSLPTSELQDMSIRIAHEVTQRSQAPPLPMTTPVVPSNSFLGKPQHPSQQHGNVARAMLPSGGSLGQQAMQNAPMQLLPKATGLPALQYFDQFIYPLYSLPVLSAPVLSEKYDDYIKPGRNNILELAMAIGLQLQGIFLACPDKGQVNTAEGRIFKAFIQTSRPQSDQRAQSGDKTVLPVIDSKVSIESVKGWLEPSRHRSRAKDIVKHVMMRRCLKSGFDYDDVIETSLLGYYHLLRGEVSSFHLCIGNAQRQVALLALQPNTRDDALWNPQDMSVLQAKATAMEYLHPISFFSQAAPSAFTVKDEKTIDNDFVLIQERLSEIASLLQGGDGFVNERPKIDVEVDDRLSCLKKSLPGHVQASIRSDWLTSTGGRVDSDWISDMIRGETMTPSLRLHLYLNISFMRLVARQSYMCQALSLMEVDTDQKAKVETNVDGEVIEKVRQVEHIASSMMSSTQLAFTVFPHLICLSQLFAAELTASAWSYTVAQLVLLDSATEEQRQEMQEGLKRMEDKVTSLAEYLNASQEKESWFFAASLEMVKSIIVAVQEDGSGAKKWLKSVHDFSTAHSQVFTRLLKGDACAVDDFRKQTAIPPTTTETETENATNTTNP